ncbi:MAG: DUF4388 domain-containing protein [Nitrospirota bacterium]|nr:DUF4388 domain-containing protein [Nitrospirota bacterium]
MALEGSLKDFGLADILQLIYFQRKTGVLALDSRADKVKLLFVDGNIVGAESKRRNEDNRLGKILVKRGLIKDEDLRAVLEEQRRTGIKLGTALIQRELIDKEKIKEVLNSQITETVVQLFGWQQGTYEFAAQGVPQDKELPFSLDTQHLLMEGLRILDELSIIKDRITLDTLFVRKGNDTSDLTEEEKEVFACVDGNNDVSTIIDLTGMDSYLVSKTFLSLMEKGMVDAQEAAPVIPPEGSAGERKTGAALKYMPYLAVAASLILSFVVVFMQKDDTLKVFDASKKIRELRFSIEAARLKNATYPPSISAITEKPDPWGRPYIYSVSENGFFVKSSGQDRADGTSDDIY